MSRTRTIVYSDGSKDSDGDFPVAIEYRQEITLPGDSDKSLSHVVDPVFDGSVTRNLYGRMMTIVEATTDKDKLPAVKNLFSKELMAWENDVYRSARDIANGTADSGNIYAKSYTVNIEK